jgi:adenosylcobinamide kinase / adenosylcobinamide-phosphate guanylyltransferase
MNKITFILGGARSGKSFYALSLAKRYKKVAFIATCQGKDKEMRERIKLHKETRPKHWETFEEPREMGLLLKKIVNGFDCIVIDCLTLLVSNLLLAGGNQKTIEEKIKQMLVSLKNKKANVIIVSNEVGLGIVPEHKMARDFRDIAGRLNQLVACYADEVFFIVAGLPLNIKTQKGRIK